MLSMRVEGNSIIYVFEKELAEQAKQLYPLVAAKILNVSPSDFGFIGTEKQNKKPTKTLDSIQKKVGGKEVKLTLNTPRTSRVGIEDLYRQKEEIRSLVAEMCSRYGLQYGNAWKKAYRILRLEDGYDVKKLGECRLTGKDSKSLLARVLLDGKGNRLIQLLSDVVDR
ncbi:hypothetical protein QUF99_15090 [Bacillus sp. DX4.1]|uniref:hypothetical protein n=1 Tax=Bacillus sp. DX4.1 TaxID=3055867 RepID=UPI0025A12F3A|nr:hypothetical protein [Bacillus sp. DX4.1]MDM5188593.1 hypothetical protein [Bacillus sp. DX4.1]